MKTADIFNHIQELRVLCQCNPDSNDLFSQDQLNNLEVIKLEQFKSTKDKIPLLFKQLCEAPKLKKLRVDMNGLDPLPILSDFFLK